MSTHKLRLCNPADQNCHHGPQERVLSEVATWAGRHKQSPVIRYLNYVGGRGCGKTTIALIVLMQIALQYTDQRTFWSARSNGEIDNVLLTELETNVPSALYKIVNKPGARYIRWLGGHKTYLISRNVDNPKKRVALGFNTMGGIHDEAATGFSLDKITDINNGIREQSAPFLFCITTSTPLPNAYQLWCTSDESVTIYASSYDSPFLSSAVLDSMAAMMDEETVKQELLGRFIITTGRMWDKFVEAPWPDGNILESVEFDPDRPFYIGGDIGGGQSAFQIVQYFDPLHPVTGRKMFQGKIACVVAELVPHQMGLEAVMGEVIEHYCGGDHIATKPKNTIVGHDIESKSVLGPTGAEYFKHLGWPYTWNTGTSFRKDVQRQVARSMILNSKGERRFCVAANKNKHGVYEIAKQHFGQRKQRGILNVMRNDTYPDPNSKEIFNKDKGRAGKNAIEDDRDAFLYWITKNHPPTFNMKTALSA